MNCEWLPCCTALITWGMVEQSNQNWMGLDRRHSVTRGRRSGLAVKKFVVNWVREPLVVDSDGQDRRKDSMVPL